MVAAAWRMKLAGSIARNRKLVDSKYFQLATVKLDGRPANRTVVFRSENLRLCCVPRTDVNQLSAIDIMQKCCTLLCFLPFRFSSCPMLIHRQGIRV